MAETRVKFRADKSIRLKRRIRRRRLSYLWASLVFLLIASLTTVLISRAFFFQPYRFEIGKVMGRTIRAPFPFDVEDKETYAKAIEAVAKRVPRCYVYDSSVEDKMLRTLKGVRQAVIAAHSPAGVNAHLFSDTLKRKFGLTLSDNATTTLLHIGNDRKFYDNLKLLLRDIMTNRGVIDDKYTYETFEKGGLLKLSAKFHQPPAPFTSTRLIDYPEELRSILGRSVNIYFQGAHSDYLSAAFELALSLVEPNVTYQPDLTEAMRKKLIARVEEVKRRFARGKPVIEASQKVDAFHARALSRLNERIRAANLMQVLANALLVVVFFSFVAFFVHKYRPDLGFTAPNVILISLPVLLALGLGRLLIQLLRVEPLLAGYAFPAGVIGILAVVLLDARIALLLVSWGAFLFGLSVDMNFKITLLAFIGGMTSVWSLYNVRERKEMLMAGFRIALVNFATILILEYIDDPTGELHIYASRAVWGLGNGIACAIIAFPALSFFEVFFGVVTDVRLLELTGIRQPPLCEMEEKAPGSYQHSLNVAKLSEPAAIAIGVNYLLVRAGAYYHDIGKIIKPKYYSENQSTPEDKKIYQNISPHMSVLIIKNHIKEGVELAKKYSLPQAVIDFIPQHHGTSLIRYFYNLALKRFEEGKSNDPIRKEDFRYPGPKPQTIETAIVMLADSVEATVTSRLSQTHIDEDDIRLVVHNSILEQFNDGQFDECNMTLRHLHIIEESFVKTLLSRYHYRIDYAVPSKTAHRGDVKPAPASAR